MPGPIRSIAIRLVIGAGIGWTFILVLAGSDDALLTLIRNSAEPSIVLIMLGVSFGSTFGIGYLSTALLIDDKSFGGGKPGWKEPMTLERSVSWLSPIARNSTWRARSASGKFVEAAVGANAYRSRAAISPGRACAPTRLREGRAIMDREDFACLL